MTKWEKIKAFFDKTPRPIKWMFTRVGRIMTLSVIAAIVFWCSQIPSISYDANAVLFYLSIAIAGYPIIAGMWYIANGIIINPFIMLVGEDPKNKTINKIVKFIRKWQLKIH
tara:strand:- start:4015 stop:4350 length:336 start_codon:yes stop_codon:yes gene_type:complete